MLENKEFIEESLINSLYYLRTMREFCARVEVSLSSKYQNYIDKAKNLALKCEELGRDVIKYANGNINQDILNKDIIVTKYTLSLEELTEKLFDIDINTNLTKEELNIKPGTLNETDVLVKETERINQEALNLANQFVEFSTEMYNKTKNQELFSFYYNSVNSFMIYEIKTYILILERLINKNKTDPIFVVDYEYGFNALLRGIATLIRGEIDPIYSDIFKKANDFVLEYDNLVKEYENIVITPENQENMRNNSLELANRFKTFLIECIEKLLNKEIYFISAPITKDNALTDINFFIYNLEK